MNRLKYLKYVQYFDARNSNNPLTVNVPLT